MDQKRGNRFAVNHRSLAATVLAIACLAAAAHADTFVDPLDDWSKVAGHSDGLTLDSTNPTLFYNDESRVKNADSSQEGSFYYHFPGITRFSAIVYYWNKLGTVSVYSSPDNTNWTPVTVSETTPVQTSAAVSWTASQISASLPPHTDYLAFDLHGGASPNVWTPQVGQIQMETEDIAPSMPGPAGLTVVAAGGKACLAWYPVKDATSYTVKRRKATASGFQKVASGITDTMFTDSGIAGGVKYYYTVTANVDKETTDNSDQVLAVSKPASTVLVDPLTDWGLTSSHDSDLEMAKVVDAVDCVRRMGVEPQSFVYNLPGSSGFSLDIYSKDADMNNEVKVQVSEDGENWTEVPLSLKLSAKIDDATYGVTCSPSGQLPPGSNYLRFTVDAGGDSPSLAQLRITYAGANPVKTAAEHMAPAHN